MNHLTFRYMLPVKSGWYTETKR